MLGRSVLLSVGLWAGFLGVVRVTVVPPESCGEDNIEAISAAALSANDWMQRVQNDDGSYVYIYYTETDAITGDYNEVRHAGVTMALYQAAGRLADQGSLETADRAMDWMIEQLVRQDGWAALPSRFGDLKLGSTALMTVGLAERRLATADESYDGLMRELGSFMTDLQREDGGFFIGRGRDRSLDTTGTSRYYPGEAFFALTLLDKAFPGEGWDAPARLAADFLTTKRDEVENVKFPPLADQWTAYGLAELADSGLDPHHVDYAWALAARFGFLVRSEAQRDGSWYGQLVRGGREPRASGIGTWTEALGSLWRASQKDERLADLAPAIEDRLLCISGIMADRQTDGAEAEDYAQAGLVEGAWVRNGETRMDDQQHAFSGLLYALDVLDGRVQREPESPSLEDAP